jgi:hypothetical protein
MNLERAAAVITADLPDVPGREDALTRARQIVGPDAPLEHALAVADWLLTGGVPIDPARLTRAARATVDARGHDWTKLSAGARSQAHGEALATITAYLA